MKKEKLTKKQVAKIKTEILEKYTISVYGKQCVVI